VAYNVSIVAEVTSALGTREISGDIIWEGDQVPTRSELQSEVQGIVDTYVDFPRAGRYARPGESYTFTWEVQSVFEIGP